MMQWRAGAALALALGLAACGGAGGGVATVPVPTPAPTPTPTPAPTPTPTPSAFDTSEYRRSAAAQVQALVAYDRGVSGQGVTVAMIDSGVNPALAEFSGRIAASSRDVASTRVLADERGHGTSVAAVALAARDGNAIHGVAPLATLLALRADTPGTCTDSGCSYASTAIAAGIDAAVADAARVINLSLGGDGTTAAVRAAAARAGSAGVVIVVAAGNDSQSSPSGFANQLVAQAPGTTIVVGAVDSSGALAEFSNRAGVLAANVLVAPGVSVRSFNQDGTAFQYGGTSIAAPVVSGAVALLASGFPMLTGAQIVDILLRTADDLGDIGTDPIFGRGRINIARAFAPVGGLSSDGTAISFGGMLGGPLGDGGALRSALAAVPAQDAFRRPYTVNLAGSIGLAPSGRLAARLMARRTEQAVVEAGSSAAAFALNGDSRNLWAGDRATLAALAPGAPVGAVSGHVLLALPGGQRLAAGHGEAVANLLALADSHTRVPPVITSDPALVPGSQPLGAAALVQPVGTAQVSMAFGQAVLPAERSAGAALARGLSSTAMFRLSRPFGRLMLGGELRFDDERGSVAGTRLTTGFGLNGASTGSVGFSALLALGPVVVAADWRHARSRLRLGRGLLRGNHHLSGTAASVSALVPDLWRAGDSFAVTLTRPLALAGAVNLAGFDTPIQAGPMARETAVEAGYVLPIAGGGQLQFNLFHRDNPGHVAASSADDGVAMQLGWRW